MPRTAEDSWRRDPRAGVLVLLFGIGVLGFAGLVASAMLYPAFVAFDKGVSAAFVSIESPALEAVFRVLTRLGDIEVMLSLTLVGFAVLWMLRRRAEAVLLAATVALGTALGSLLKEVLQRARPEFEYVRIPLPDTYSFPSGHALASFLLFSTVSFIVVLEARRVSTRVWVVAFCAALGVGVGLSRVYLGVHYFGDVVASWMLGGAWMTVTTAAYFWFTRRQAE